MSLKLLSLGGRLSHEFAQIYQMHYIEVYFCQQSEFGDSADSSMVDIN